MTDYYVLDWTGWPTIVGSVVYEPNESLANPWTQGQRFPPENIPTTLEVRVESEPEEAYPDYFTLQQIPIVSDRFVQALRGTGLNNVDLFAAPLIDPSGVRHGHQVMNVIGRVDCLDRDASEYTTISPRSKVILRMKKMVIDPEKAQGLDMFRVHGFPLAVLISERVKRAVEGLAGVSVSPAIGWGDAGWF